MSISDQVSSIIAAELRRPLDRVQPESDLFEDIGAGELDRLSIICRFEEAFKLRLDDQDFEGLRTVAELTAMVERKLARTETRR